MKACALRVDDDWNLRVNLETGLRGNTLGSGHLFADPGLPDFNEPATALAKGRVLSLLAKVCQRRVGGT
jgi:hypothetical protein